MIARLSTTFALLTLTAMTTSAAGPLGRRYSRARTNTNHAIRTTHSYAHLLDSPEKMTALFGPSILVRQESAKRPVALPPIRNSK